jgi:hypothetical protein
MEQNFFVCTREGGEYDVLAGKLMGVEVGYVSCHRSGTLLVTAGRMPQAWDPLSDGTPGAGAEDCITSITY